MTRRRGLWLALLAVAAVAALILRILLAPRPLDLSTAPASIQVLRAQIAVATLITGAGLGLAAVASQAQARDARVDASLAGPLWGALPALLLPVDLWLQALAAVAGALLVARVTGRTRGGLPMVLTRGIAVAGLVVSLAALGLFLGPGLTATTALAFLHASLGGSLPAVTPDHLVIGGLLVAAATGLAIVAWRELLLSRTGLQTGGWTTAGVVSLSSAGTVVLAGVVPGLGLLAVILVRRLIGEHPLHLIPGAMLAGAGTLLALDGLGQIMAWPGEMPVGVLTGLLASAYLVREVVAR